MAKESMKAREVKREKLINKYKVDGIYTDKIIHLLSERTTVVKLLADPKDICVNLVSQE